MRSKKLSELLAHAFKHRRKVLIVGEPGIGKSEIVEQACKDTYELHICHPAVSDPTDYKGMPAVVHRDGMDVAEFLPFGDLTKLINATVPTVCFIDDIGQSTPAVQGALMQLIQARRVNGHKISEHVVFCGATNDTTHMAGVSGLLEPVKSRWDTIVKLESHLDDWCEWAYANNMPTELIAFIRFRPQLLSDFKPTRELKNSPCPRNVASVGRWVAGGIRDHEVIAGACGEGFATEFIGFLKMHADLPDLDAILLTPDTAPVPEAPAALYAVSAGLARKASPGNLESVMRYIKRIPKEFEVCCVRDFARMDQGKLCYTPQFKQWATRNSGVLN